MYSPTKSSPAGISKQVTEINIIWILPSGLSSIRDLFPEGSATDALIMSALAGIGLPFASLARTLNLLGLSVFPFSTPSPSTVVFSAEGAYNMILVKAQNNT